MKYSNCRICRDINLLLFVFKFRVEETFSAMKRDYLFISDDTLNFKIQGNSTKPAYFQHTQKIKFFSQVIFTYRHIYVIYFGQKYPIYCKARGWQISHRQKYFWFPYYSDEQHNLCNAVAMRDFGSKCLVKGICNHTKFFTRNL